MLDFDLLLYTKDLIVFLLFLSLFYYLNVFFKNQKILIDQIYTQSHKAFATKNLTPLTGGIFLLFIILTFLNNDYLILKIFLSLIFLNGIISDPNFLENPNYRFYLQIIVILFFVYLLDLRIESIRIIYFDDLLKNNYFNIFFVVFCLVLIVNGFNFIDGLNTLSLGYFISVILNLKYISNSYGYDLEIINESFIIIYLLTLFLLIFFGIVFLGDSGSYILGLFLGFIILEVNKNFPEISPWYFALLLWYPAFEILFSIIRKFLIKNSPFSSDNGHFHQLLFLKVKRLSKNYANPFTACLINLYNLVIFYVASQNIYSSKLNIFLIVSNILIYLIIFKAIFKK